MLQITDDRLSEVIKRFVSGVPTWGTPADTGTNLALLGEDVGSINAIIARHENNLRVYEVPEDSDLPVREHIPPSDLRMSLLSEDEAGDEMDLWAVRFSISEDDGTIEVSEVGDHVLVVTRGLEKMLTD